MAQVIVGRSGGDDSAVGASSIGEDRSVESSIQEILLALGASNSQEARTLSGEAGAAISGESSRGDHVGTFCGLLGSTGKGRRSYKFEVMEQLFLPRHTQ